MRFTRVGTVMHVALAFMLGVGLAAVTSGQSPRPPIPCGVSLKDSISRPPKIDGPRNLIARLTVVPQTDSAIEITAVDLSKVKAIITGSSYQLEQGGEYALMLRNRSDQPVYEVGGTILFRIGNHKASGFGLRWLMWRGPVIAPGETVRFAFGSDNWSAAEPDGDVALFAAVEHIKFTDCAYVPSSSHLSAAQK